jgi:hypothetical protein
MSTKSRLIVWLALAAAILIAALAFFFRSFQTAESSRLVGNNADDVNALKKDTSATKNDASVPLNRQEKAAHFVSGEKLSEPNATNIADWRNVGVSMSALSVYSAAEQSQAPDDRMIALWVNAICETVSTETDESITQRVEFLETSDANRGGSVQKSSELKASVTRARDKLSKFCTTTKSTEANAIFARILERAKQESSLTKSIRQLSNTQPADWSDEQRAKVMEVLSEPTRYPYALDIFLTRILSGTSVGDGANSLTLRESLAVRAAAYQELTGDHNANSVRALFVCVNHLVCTNATGSYIDGSPILARAANELHNAIRDQRWKDVGL